MLNYVAFLDKNFKTWFEHVTALTACLLVFSGGITMGWPGPSLPRILSEEYPFNVTNTEANNIAIIAYLGSPVGVFLFMFLFGKLGRKKTLILTALPQITTFLMVYFSSYTSILLYVSRFLGGVGEGAAYSIVPIYLCEIADPKIRGKIGFYVTVNLTTGIAVINIIGGYFTIYTTALICLIFPVLFLILSSFVITESPYYNILTDQLEEAKSNLRRLRRNEQIDEEFVTKLSNYDTLKNENNTYRSIFTIKHNLIAFGIAATIYSIERCGGIPVFTAYNQLFFEKTGSIIPKEHAAMAVFVVQMFNSILIQTIIDKFGRKPLLLVSSCGCFIVLLIFSVYFTIKEYFDETLYVSWLSVTGVIIYVIFFSSGLGPVSNLFTGELFSSNIKSKASSLVYLIYAILTIVNVKFYHYFADNVGLSVPFYFFTTVMLLGAIFIYKYVPETKEKTLEKIQQELINGTY